MDRSNQSPSEQPNYLLSEADNHMLEIILREKKHDKTYKQCMTLIITLIDSYVRSGVHHGLFRVENGCVTEFTFTGVDVLTAAIESNQTTVVNWLTSHIKDDDVYCQAIMVIGKSQHEESETMFFQALRQGSQLEMVCPGLVTECLRTIVHNAFIYVKEIAQSAPSKEVIDKMMCVTEDLAIKKVELLFSHSVEPFGWPGSLIELVADDEIFDDLPSYLEATYLDFCDERRCYILP